MSLATFADQIFRMSMNAYRAGRGRRLQQDSFEYWQELPTKVLNEASCAFVLSTGRCGTRLLTKVLHRCGNVDVNHHAELANELQFPSRRVYEAALKGGTDLEMAALCCRFEQVQTSFLNRRIYIETNNRITFLAPSLHKVFKNSRFLHVVRNPGSFVRSGVNAGFYSGGYYDTGRISPNSGSAKAEWSEYSQVRKVAWLWNATNQFVEDFKETAGPDRVMTVCAEDLFKQTDAISRVIDFFGGKEISQNKLKRLSARSVNAGQSNGLPSSFDDWPQQDQRDLQRECPLAEHYGYSVEVSSPRQTVSQKVA